MSRRGAPPIEESLRLLLAIADALSRKGSVIDAKGVAYLLGITREEAATAIGDVQEAAVGADASTGVVLPLEGDPEQGVHLMADARPIRALRMTHAEAQALAETLDILGVDDEALGGIRPKIERALFPKGMRSAPVKERDTSTLPRLLVLCLDALYCNKGLEFDYAGERGVAQRRVVEPLSLTYLFGQWVLDALDLGDGAVVSRETDEVGDEGALRRRRFFLVGRIRDVASVTALDLPSTHVSLRNRPWDEGGQWVRLYFTDRSRYNRRSEWTWSREVARSELTAKERRRIGRSGCAVDVRYFAGSPYLARLIVSCAGTCTTDDPALRADIAAYLDSLPGSSSVE